MSLPPGNLGNSHESSVPPRVTALCAAVSLAAALLLLACAKGEAPDVPTESRRYVAEHVSGKLVEVADSPDGEWRTLKAGDTLRGGQCVRTSFESSVLLNGNYGDNIFLGELCRAVLDPAFLRKYAGAGAAARGIQVLSGKAWLKVARGRGTFLGKTPGGWVRVKGTRFSLAYDERQGKTRVVLEEGSVVVGQAEGGRDSVELRPGQALAWIKGEAAKKAGTAEPAELEIPPPLRGAGGIGASWPAPPALGDGDTPGTLPPAAPTTPKGKAATAKLDSVERALEASLPVRAPAKPLGDGHTAPADPRAAFEAAKKREYEEAAQARKRLEDSIRSKLERTGAGRREADAFDELDAETGH